MNRYPGGPRQTRQQRQEIIELYLRDPEAATKLAVSRGLAEGYAYNVAHASGRLPLKSELGRTHLAAMASA